MESRYTHDSIVQNTFSEISSLMIGVVAVVHSLAPSSFEVKSVLVQLSSLDDHLISV